MSVSGITHNDVKYVNQNYDPYNISATGFLNIYMKMLELQDPTEPLDINNMIQMNYQLQQISFLTNLETTMQSLLNAQQLGFITQAAFLIGKQVVMSADQINDVTVNYVLVSPSDYANVEVSIIDQNSGKVVKTYTTDLSEGINDLDLSDLSPGRYIVSVSSDGITLNDVLLGIRDTVSYVSLVGNQPVVGTASGERPLTDIVYISS